MSHELAHLGAQALAQHYRRGSLSPVEMVRATLAHIERWEPHLHATYLLRPERALEQTRASEARWRRGEPLSPLDGVPCTLKDNIATAGDPLPLGTAAADLTPAAADAPPAARLREAGAVLLAKTTMPDYGMLSSGLSSFHPLARNPWDLRKTPGGSIRLPAGWCGVFGLKPSLGRVPIDPPYTGRAAGPITRSVADAAAMMAALSQPDARDSMSLPPQAIDWSAFDAPPESLRGLRVGLLLDAGCGLPVEPEVRAAIEAAARRFEDAGAFVEPLAPFLTRDMLDGMDRFWRMRSRLDLAALAPERRSRVLPYIRAWADSVAGLDGEALFHAASQFHATRVATVRATAPFDCVLSPTAPVVAFDAHLPSPTDDPLRPLEHIAFTVPFNMSEQPAASIPCGMSAAGLPIGLQIAGRRFDDLGVLRIARAFEQIRTPLPPWPAPPEAPTASARPHAALE